MKKLFCDECGNYLETSAGDCSNCPCGWNQPEEDEEEDNDCQEK